MISVQTHEDAIAGGPPGTGGSVLVDRMPVGQLVVHSHKRTRGKQIDGEQVALRAHAGADATHQSLDGDGRRSLIVAWLKGPAFVPGSILRVAVVAKMKIEASLGIVGQLAVADVCSANLAIACDVQFVVLGQTKRFVASISATGSDAMSRAASSNPSDSYNEVMIGLREGSISSARTFTELVEVQDTDWLDADKLVSKPFTAVTRASASAHSSASRVAADAQVNVASEWSFKIAVDEP
jgi:hypothetical protein